MEESELLEYLTRQWRFMEATEVGFDCDAGLPANYFEIRAIIQDARERGETPLQLAAEFPNRLLEFREQLKTDSDARLPLGSSTWTAPPSGKSKNGFFSKNGSKIVEGVVIGLILALVSWFVVIVAESYGIDGCSIKKMLPFSKRCEVEEHDNKYASRLGYFYIQSDV